MNQPKIKIYTEINLIPKGMPHTFLLIPFLGLYPESDDDPDTGRFKEFYEKGGDYYELTESPELSDYFLLPFGYSFERDQETIIESFLNKAKGYNKKTLVFFNSDDDREIRRKDIFLYRTSTKASRGVPDEFALPGWSVDFAKYAPGNKIVHLKKTKKPEISYCGYVDYEQETLLGRLKRLWRVKKSDPESAAKALRGRACRVLKKNSDIQTHFIIRKGFWASGITDKIQARVEYATNMMSSTYALVARGGGNFSYRLYEVLSCGRIPVFIDTDCSLPFSQSIDWKHHAVWLDQKNVDQIDKVLLDFHSKIGEEALIELQLSNRKLYEDFLSPLGFFKQVYSFLLKSGQ